MSLYRFAKLMARYYRYYTIHERLGTLTQTSIMAGAPCRLNDIHHHYATATAGEFDTVLRRASMKISIRGPPAFRISCGQYSVLDSRCVVRLCSRSASVLVPSISANSSRIEPVCLQCIQSWLQFFSVFQLSNGPQ